MSWRMYVRNHYLLLPMKGCPVVSGYIRRALDVRFLGLLPLAQAIGVGAESKKGREQKATYFRAFEISFGSGLFRSEKVPPNLGGFLSSFAAPPERAPAIACNVF